MFSKIKIMRYTEEFSARIERAREALQGADVILIGAGAGLSDAAGIEYSGEKFERDYVEYIERYSFTDLYTSGFYQFPTPEERWAFWAKHIYTCRIEQGALPLYKELLKLVEDRDYFVLTTNVDAQFEMSGFAPERIFATQGDYLYLQCEVGCHDKIYNCREMVDKMLSQTQDCRVPSELVPYCPVCGGAMDMHLRKDKNFVQTEEWYKAAERYETFAKATLNKRVVYLELGVGYNTPGIIRYPFEQMTYNNDKATLVRINRDFSQAIPENKTKTVSFGEDIATIINQLNR